MLFSFNFQTLLLNVCSFFTTFFNFLFTTFSLNYVLIRVRRQFPPEAVNQLQSTAEPTSPTEDPIESDAEASAAPNNETASTDGVASCSESGGDHGIETFISTC